MKNDFDTLIEKVQLRLDKSERLVRKIYASRNLLDEDGYPNKWALLCVRIWPYNDPEGWFKFIESLWHLPEMGWSKYQVPHNWRLNKTITAYKISTGGWSGNEDIIRNMQKNAMLWSTTWFQSRRGGHYVFEVDDDSEDNTSAI